MSKPTTGTARSTLHLATLRKRSAKGCSRSRNVWKLWSRKIKHCAKSLQSFIPADWTAGSEVEFRHHFDNPVPCLEIGDAEIWVIQGNGATRRRLQKVQGQIVCVGKGIQGMIQEILCLCPDL